MFKISSTADLMRCYAGEPISFEVQLADDTGVVEELIQPGRSLVFAVYDGSSATDAFYEEGELLKDGTGDFAQWILPGSVSETFRGKSNLKWDVAERYSVGGRETLLTGTLVVDASAPVVASLGNGRVARYVTRVRRLCDPRDGIPLATYQVSVMDYQAGVLPAEVFSADFSNADNSGLLALF